MMRTIKAIHPAEYRPIDDLVTYSPMPTRRLNHIDPFLFLNHHGFQTYPAQNNGLPFGPHPHRGMETVTFILDGDIMHEDSGGHKEVIGPGGIQYMTAGRGLIHSEVSSPEFKQNGGDLEILQLWLNLPASLKMTEPRYVGKQEEEMVVIDLENGSRLQLIFGAWEGSEASFVSSYPIFLSTLYLKGGSTFKKVIPASETILCYVVRGKARVNGMEVDLRELVDFNNEGEEVTIETSEDVVIIFGHANSFHEPIVAQGPFVMNSEQEIRQAYLDYQQGKFAGQ